MTKAMQAKLNKWVPESPSRLDGTCGNIQSAIKDQMDMKQGDLLQALCMAFQKLQIETYGQDAYKVTWTVVLKHVKTGHVVTFYDWKGWTSFGSDVLPDAAPESFIKDLSELIHLLPQVKHPYGG